MTDRDAQHDSTEALAAIRRSLEQAKRGESRPMREFLESLAKEHGIRLK